LRGRCDPCILRTSPGNKIFKTLTIHKSAARVSIKESQKPVKLDSGAITVCSNVVVVKYS
jgi:hypothetical protein